MSTWAATIIRAVGSGAAGGSAAAAGPPSACACSQVWIPGSRSSSASSRSCCGLGSAGWASAGPEATIAASMSSKTSSRRIRFIPWRARLARPADGVCIHWCRLGGSGAVPEQLLRRAPRSAAGDGRRQLVDTPWFRLPAPHSHPPVQTGLSASLGCGIPQTRHQGTAGHATRPVRDWTTFHGAQAHPQADRQQLQPQGSHLRGAEGRHHLDEHLRRGCRAQARRAPAVGTAAHQPHADPRSAGAARAGGPGPHPAAQGRHDRTQVRGRDPRDDHRLGGAREHGGAPRHEPCEQCRDRLAAQDAGQVQPGRGAHPDRRIFRDQHQIPSAHSRAVEMRAAQADRGWPVHPHARDPRAHHGRGRPGAALDRRSRAHHRSARGAQRRSGRAPGARAHAQSARPRAAHLGRAGGARASRRASPEKRGTGGNHVDHRDRHAEATERRRQHHLGRPSRGQGAQERGRRHDLHAVRRPHHRHLRRLPGRGHPHHRRAPRAGRGARRRRLCPADRQAGVRGDHRRPRLHQRHDRHRLRGARRDPDPAHRRPGRLDPAQDGLAAGSAARRHDGPDHQVRGDRAFDRAGRRHGQHGGARVLQRRLGAVLPRDSARRARPRDRHRRRRSSPRPATTAARPARSATPPTSRSSPIC